MSGQVKTSKARELLSLLKKSLLGEEEDYTTGSIKKAVILLSIPMILELGMESIFAVVDMFFVSSLGKNAISTVGLTESFITIVYSIAIGLSTGTTAIIARRTGEKNHEMASKTAAQAILIGVFLSVIISIFGVIFASDILRFMGADEQVILDGTSFTQIMIGGNLVVVLLFLINGIFRGAGNASMAMISLFIATVFNIILDPIFIHYLGLKGAAIATVIGRGIGVIFQLYYLFNSKKLLKIKSNYFVPDWEIIKNILKIAQPATIQFIIASGSWVLLARLVSETDGASASAGYQIALRNVVFFILPAWGFSNAAATLVGQNLGANQLDRAEKSVWFTTKLNVIFMTLVTILFVFFPEPIIGIFTKDADVAKYGIDSLRIIGTAYIFYGVGMVMTNAINGAGDTKIPTIINLISFWIIQVPLAYSLVKIFHFDSTGVFIAIPVAETVLAILAFFYFKKGKWKLVKV